MTTYEEADEFCPHCDNHYVSGRVNDLVDVYVRGARVHRGLNRPKMPCVKLWDWRKVVAERSKLGSRVSPS